MKLGTIASVNTGLPVEMAYGRQTITTAIRKTPREGAVRVGWTGPEGDGQGDLEHHGGPDKAICVYAYDHYPYWEKELAKRLEFGAFGENVTLEGVTEQDIVIGDILAAGTALLQASQPRQPCFKLGLRHGQADLPAKVQQTGKTGFYLRVLREGDIQAGDILTLVGRPEHGMSVAAANVIYYLHKTDEAEMGRLAAIPELSSSWKETLTTRIDKMNK
ncbi:MULTISPECIES: MOSC domain-containing protein [unclassified Paenibacillus]|uniref:MOSC domain-containing protein n=1 Tax=unclassified Paenibacillus TaxID=185978 RepID=UPI0009540E60|nr:MULTISPECIES: MOSC domain-containing protein [unclassified Paenibacillus]ASS65313.1 MOSC domain-containing protein [Paenibacillus sp. RUD330]SIQ40248.1 MOSC domain-containing protein YiiM [Paenibacillus sp. RU4X]SIQ62420.1 MOSC domain-containing protein YiiM [Paenibacillus sp. RU4T]